MTIYMSGAGWYEFNFGDGNYTIRIFEDGSHHIPNPEITIDNFIFAVKRGEAWRLVRTEATYTSGSHLKLITNDHNEEEERRKQ